MSVELSYLALVALVGLITFLIAAGLVNRDVGVDYAVGPRDQKVEPSSVSAGRMARAHANFVEWFTFFAPAILLVELSGASNSWTENAARAFFLARLVYPAIYLAGIPYLRTLAWLVGFVATLILYLTPLI